MEMGVSEPKAWSESVHLLQYLIQDLLFLLPGNQDTLFWHLGNPGNNICPLEILPCTQENIDNRPSTNKLPHVFFLFFFSSILHFFLVILVNFLTILAIKW